MTEPHVRIAILEDAAAIALIYNQGIEERLATFETRQRSADDIAAWFDGQHPIVFAEHDGQPAGFAATSSYRARECYAGIAEFSVYVHRERRGCGVGRALMRALITEAAAAGYWKLVSRVFTQNQASLQLLRHVGFREVGIYQRHAQLDGIWRDVVIVERLLDETDAASAPAARHGV